MVRTQGRVKKRIWQAGLILTVVILLVGFRLVEQIGFERHPDDRFIIVRVIDGDTVELAGGGSTAFAVNRYSGERRTSL